jgi:hypothetical protein
MREVQDVIEKFLAEYKASLLDRRPANLITLSKTEGLLLAGHFGKQMCVCDDYSLKLAGVAFVVAQ